MSWKRDAKINYHFCKWILRFQVFPNYEEADLIHEGI